jgi:hypothetical protein
MRRRLTICITLLFWGARGCTQNAVDIPESVKASLTTEQLKKLEVRGSV